MPALYSIKTGIISIINTTRTSILLASRGYFDIEPERKPPGGSLGKCACTCITNVNLREKKEATN